MAAACVGLLVMELYRVFFKDPRLLKIEEMRLMEKSHELLRGRGRRQDKTR
ncbi:predicted protein [Sclerotinia sclerotiorum 1980 UF-70]|uniref:Uncharacterized protein n=1 Tax=Sclerotinia sclerotiorum (strain ATCC 18683 / 1980 / Ss-1) TaxID=665079 RepID=A7ENU6_SCLS1|nr:predicted protein [Sclerotinia sclerotiorum 1980 UF-70]EDO04512.1 predicted protein [Sclerotinia sclerotiorum 1980 UF-70]